MGDQQESICSEDSIPLVHTPQFRQVPTNSSDQSEPVKSEVDKEVVTESISSDFGDISDASFRKRHAKPELRERNLVKSDKQHQLELYKRNIRNRKQTNKDNQ